LEKLRLPARGRMLLIPKKPFRGKPRKGFLGRDEFFQRIFLIKVSLGLYLRRKKERGENVKKNKPKNEENFRMGYKKRRTDYLRKA
jgi:hypothetical protein